MSNKTSVSYGPGLPTLLFITFLVLKLTHVIDWSWWWVTAPLWIPFGLFIGIFIVVLIIAAVASILEI